MTSYLEFEKSIADLDGKIAELKALAAQDSSMSIDDEVNRLQEKSNSALANTYANLDAWQKTQVSRHPERPHFSDLTNHIFEEFTPLAGDRNFAEDYAIVGGAARFNGRAVFVIGHETGNDTESRLKHNFGMARPEGYRKAQRLMKMADRFNMPVISLVNTMGAYPGIGAEARGQAEAIARSTEVCLQIGVPMLAVIVGEGQSGGAIGIAAANKVMMLENSIYSVISPEGAASILWRDAKRAKDAALNMKITAKDLLEFGIIEEIITEPVGGAHRDPVAAMDNISASIAKQLAEFDGMSKQDIVAHRHNRFLDIGRSL
ncbi:MAG: acetyl-CoA carboxylase carboxyltransferase subunit alpha [Rhizobiales bacterium]|nr:acetyl-CoA carboxylase carboxyltransferase subunit alpha [Hyphomicrobiales bacterium]